jgi:acylphosphatase
MAVRAHLTIRGRVQGVWYRGAMQEEARHLGVVGWVENAPDGSVVAEVEGERPAVDALVAWAHHGPAGARVDGVDVDWRPPLGTERGTFAIRR